MIPAKTIEELIEKHSILEKELSSGSIDKKLLRHLTVKVKKFDLDTNYFSKKEDTENKERKKKD